MKLIYKNNNYQIQEITVEELNINGLELPLNKQITSTYAKNLTHQRLINALHKEDNFSPISLGSLTNKDNLVKRIIILDGYKRYKALLNFPNKPFLIEIWDVNTPEELTIKHLEYFNLDDNFYKLQYSLFPYLKNIKAEKKNNYNNVIKSVEFLLCYLFCKPLNEDNTQDRFFTTLNLDKVISRLKNKNIISDFNTAVEYINNVTYDYYTAKALVSKFGTKLPFNISKDYILNLTKESYYYSYCQRAEFIYNNL